MDRVSTYLISGARPVALAVHDNRVLRGIFDQIAPRWIYPADGVIGGRYRHANSNEVWEELISILARAKAVAQDLNVLRLKEIDTDRVPGDQVGGATIRTSDDCAVDVEGLDAVELAATEKLRSRGVRS